MNDQTTPEPLTDDDLTEIRMHNRAYATDPSDAPILVEADTDRRLLLAEVDRLRAEARRLHTWDGLMSLLDEHWPEAILPTLPDEPARDAGSRIVSLIRWIEMLHTETRRLGVSLAETIQERQQLRTRLADAEQTRRAALAVAADLTEDLAEARAHEPATATGAPDPDPSEGPAPTGLPGAAQGPAPLTLAQAATALHDWAGDLADGTRTDWPAGHPDIIRGIRAAADWLDARDKYETETREQLRALVNRHGMADRTCLISDNTTE